MKHAACCYVPKLDKSGLVLGVLNPHYAAWAFPGGKVEGDESLEVAALRELREETGITRVRRIVHQMSGVGSADPSYMVHVFTVDTVEEPRTIEPGNTVAWVTPVMLCESKAFGPFYETFFRGVNWRPKTSG